MSRNDRLRFVFAALVVLFCLPLMGSALIAPGSIQAAETDYTTGQVRVGTFVKEMTSSASVYLPTLVDVRCTVHDARVAEISAERSYVIIQGTKLGVLRSEGSRANLTQTELDLRRMKDDYQTQVRQREEALNQRQADIQKITDPVQREIAQLELRKAQLQLADYKLGQEKSIADTEEYYAEQVEALQDVKITAPASGRVVYYSNLTLGESVPYNSVILTLQTNDPTLLRVEDPDGRWRYGMDVKVEYGTASNRQQTTGRVISADNLLPPTERTGYAYIKLTGAFDATTTTVSVTGEEVRLDNVLLVPKKAVTLHKGKDIVSITDGTAIAGRYVNAVMENKTDTWVLQGLSEGQTVILD